jgi:hypothetical protein
MNNRLHRAADAKSLTVAFWYKIVAFSLMIFLHTQIFDGLIGTRNEC